MSTKSSLIFIELIFTYKVIASISVVDTGILTLNSNSVGIRFYIDITNENRRSNCKLYSRCKKCCFIDPKDCNTMMAFGEDILTVKPRDRKTLLYVAPMLQQHDLIGYCEFSLNYNCNKTKERTNITIPFDTRTGAKNSKELMKKYIGSKRITSCDTLDEDSLNNCEPVNCNMKYLDKKPVYDLNLNKCVEVPICLTNPDKELPDYVYVPISNMCRNLDLPLEMQDIYAISSGLGTVTMPSTPTFQMKLKVNSNCSTISQNLNLIRDMMYGRLCPEMTGVDMDYSECFKSALFTIAMCILGICFAMFLLVFCINTSVWLYIQWSEGRLSRKWRNIKDRCKTRDQRRGKRERVDRAIRNALLREVIVKDIPLELRESVIDVCDRMGRQVKSKKRYRVADIGSQVSLQGDGDSIPSSTSNSSGSENERD